MTSPEPERSRVDPLLAPSLLVVVPYRIALFIQLADLPPLVHLDFAGEAVSIPRGKAKFLINQVRWVVGVAAQMHKFELIRIIDPVSNS